MNLETFDFDVFSNLLCEHFEQNGNGNLEIFNSNLIWDAMNKAAGYDCDSDDYDDVFYAAIDSGIIIRTPFDCSPYHYHLNSAIYEVWKVKQCPS